MTTDQTPASRARRGCFIMGNDLRKLTCVSCGQPIKQSERYNLTDDGPTHQGRCR